MDKQTQLREKLTQLHDELAVTESLDEGTRIALSDLHSEIGNILDSPSNQDDLSYAPLIVRLRANLVSFETTHPRLTGALERVIDALVQMGV